MTRASRTRGPSNQSRATISLPPNPTPVPGSVPPIPMHRKELARADRKPRYAALRGEERSRLLERTSELATAGEPLEDIAKALGVDIKMLMRWCAEDEAFFHALNPDWKVKAARVEDALYRRAIGYMARTTTSKIVTKTGQPDEVHTTTKVEQIAPDPTSAILFLEVYKPEVYKRDKNNLLVITPPGDHQQNPRQLAMALLAVLREAAQTTIDITPALEAAE